MMTVELHHTVILKEQRMNVEQYMNTERAQDECRAI
jgi:hypothetical protein